MIMETMCPFENEFVAIERIHIGGIPCLKIRPKGSRGQMPTVIFYHGWSSNKEYQRFRGVSLATYGYQLILPDALHHGERNPIQYDDPKMMEEYFWKVVFQNVEESSMLIEGIIENHDGDPHRIGVMGSSMGGFSASGVFVHNPQIKCLINFNGSCAWGKAEEIFRQKGRIPAADPSHLEILAQYDPLQQKEALGGRPILMLHGSEDSSVPIDCQRIFYQEAAPLYKDEPEKLQLQEVPRLNHYITTGMLEEAILWLEKYL
jgi:dienelactone hydrolase